MSETFARYPGIQVSQVPTGWLYEEAVEILLHDLEEWPKLTGGRQFDAIVGMSDPLALAGRDVGRKYGFAGPQTLIAGINGDPLAISAIVDGSMYVTIETNPQDLGHKLADFAMHSALGEVSPSRFPYAFEVVTAENVSQVAARKLLAIADLPTRLVDVTMRLEEQRLVQMQTSLELNRYVGSILNEEDLLQALTEVIRSRYDYTRVQLFLWSDHEKSLVLSDPTVAHVRTVPLAAAGALGDALLRNQMIYIPDVHASRRYEPDPLWPVTRSRVILPVQVGGRTLGVLDLHSENRTVRNAAELDALQLLADQLGSALRNTQLYTQALRTRAEAVQARMVKSRLFAMAGHQLRSPLRRLLQLYHEEVVGLGGTAAGHAGVASSVLDTSGRHLQRLLDDLLAIAQSDDQSLPYYPEPLEASAFLEEFFDAAQTIFARADDVRWRLQAPAVLPPLYADPARLQTALFNLLENAARYTERGQIILGAEVNALQMHLWVQDTGTGMTEAMLEQVRRSMVMGTANARPGAGHGGLGLGIVYQIVTQHGGTVRIESEWGRGAIVHIQWPLVSALKATPRLTPIADEPHLTAEPAQARHSRFADPLVQKVRDYVAANYTMAFSREDIAGVLGVSSAYVSRIFRRSTGMALWDYVNHYRVDRACELLENTDMTVTEVAFAVGFNDPAYFSRVFRAETGKSPLQYRKLR
jgi:signal transduction histidine kinase/AraC-like DNA-binding protein